MPEPRRTVSPPCIHAVFLCRECHWPSEPDRRVEHGSGKDEQLKQDLDALRRFVLESYDYMIDGLQALDPDTLDEEIAFFRLRMPRSILLAKALEHHAHHRGQAAVYLRLSGITPPSQRLF